MFLVNTGLKYTAATNSGQIENPATMKSKGLEKWASEAKDIKEKYFKGKFKIGADPQNKE